LQFAKKQGYCACLENLWMGICNIYSWSFTLDLSIWGAVWMRKKSCTNRFEITSIICNELVALFPVLVIRFFFFWKTMLDVLEHYLWNSFGFSYQYLLLELQVVALREDGCPKVWVVTSDICHQHAAHGAVCFPYCLGITVSCTNFFWHGQRI